MRNKFHSSPQIRRGFSLYRFSANSQTLNGITWDRISPTSAPKYGKYWQKMIYAPKYSMTVTDPIFKTLPLARQLYG